MRRRIMRWRVSDAALKPGTRSVRKTNDLLDDSPDVPSVDEVRDALMMAFRISPDQLRVNAVANEHAVAEAASLDVMSPVEFL